MLAASTSLVPRSLAGRIAIGATVVYASLAALVAVGYRTFLYPAPKAALEPRVSGATLLRFAGDDGEAVALFAPPPAGRPVWVHFHGNGEELVDLSALARELVDARLGALFVEYPGYGLMRGQKPTEASLYAAAEGALAQLEARGIGRDRIVLVGQSLGSGVAMEMAIRGRGGRLVLISPFTSIVDMVQRFAPIVPARLLVADRFDNEAKAPRVDVPTLVVHGDADTLIPSGMGRAVADAVRGAELELVPGAGHNDLFVRGGGMVLRRILDFAGRPSGGPDGPHP